MSHPQKEVTELKRPRLLMSAAAELVKRRRFLGRESGPLSTAELQRLMQSEEALEKERQEARGAYRAEAHIEMLASLIEQAKIIMSGGLQRIQ